MGVGYGVWHRGGREPLPEEAENEWYRRGLQFDIASMCWQVWRLPPDHINTIGEGPPVYVLKRPFGERDQELQPASTARIIIQKHLWGADVEQSPIDVLPTKALVLGNVLHAEAPPEPEFDVTDPEIFAKIQRGDDLGKGLQEEGLPGALHGSIGLLFAMMCHREDIENVKFCSGQPDEYGRPEADRFLPIPDLVRCFLRFGPPFRSLDFSGCALTMCDEILDVVANAGPSLLTLDLEDCGLGKANVESLIRTFGKLTGLTFVDLGHNSFDAESAYDLVCSICRVTPMSNWEFGRIDVATVRLDGNPIDNTGTFRDKIAALLSERGGQVVAGGEFILPMSDTEVLWHAGAVCGSQVHAAVNKGVQHVETTALKDLEKNIKKSEQELLDAALENHFVERTPAYLARKEYNEMVLNHPLIVMFKEERAAVIAEKEEREKRHKKASKERTGSKLSTEEAEGGGEGGAAVTEAA